MSSYVSTRGAAGATLTDAVLRGLAPDGGLYVPASRLELPALPPTGDSVSFLDVARWAAPSFFPGVPSRVLDDVIDEALSFPIELVELRGGVFVLELFHGPTHAFKDVGARFLARLLASLTVNHVRRTVLVATSGDTGGAVGAAFHGVPGFRVVILFPREGVSERQRRQMTTLGGNVTALAVQGSFDDCQRLAKEGFLDRELARTHALTSANSINVGRLLPQALYYVYAAATLGWDASPARFVVPCGNLGNLCAGLLANTAGMPAAAFLAATNSNSVFADFLHGSPFEPRSTTPTVSNAMDVGDPSNLERVLWLHGGDEDALRSRVRGVSIDDASTIRCIAEVHERTGYVLDPHTAVAFEAHRRHHSPPDVPSVVLATAHPAKFPEVVSEAIGFGVRTPPGINRTMQAEEHMLDIPPELNALRAVLDETSD